MTAEAGHLQTAALDMNALVGDTANPEDGALVVFAGTVRRHNAGREVARLEYSVYEPLAEKALADIEARTERDYDITSCRIRHRIGAVAIGDTSVLVVVRAPHRAEAFEAGRHAIDTVKHAVPIWKREEYTDGSHSFVKGCSLHGEDQHA